MTIIITINSVYAFWIDVLLLTHDNAQDVLLDDVARYFVGNRPPWVGLLNTGPPGSVAQFVPVWTLPKIWIPTPSIMAMPINAATSPIILDDSAIRLVLIYNI